MSTPPLIFVWMESVRGWWRCCSGMGPAGVVGWGMRLDDGRCVFGSVWSGDAEASSHGVHQHSGSFYVQGNAHYYTPTPIVRVNPTSFQSAHVHPTPVVQQPVQLQFGGFARIEDLAGRLETEANRLCLDMFYNYQHNPRFNEVYKEAYSLLESSRFVHAKQHQGDRDAIRHHVTQMDGLLHHVQGELRPWSRNNARQIGSGGIIEKSSAVEAILHHLCFDVGIEPHGDDEPAPAPSVGEEQAPAPGGVINSPPPLGF